MKKPTTSAYIISLLLSFCMVILACSTNSHFEKFEDVSNDSWLNADTIEFNYIIDSTASVEQANIHIRHASSYQFRNLWVQIEHSIDGVESGQRHELDLAAASGKWYGDKTGAYLNFKDGLGEQFLSQGEHKIRLVQIMRQDPLQGIQSVGLSIE